MSKLIIIAPSYINSIEREKLAKKSLASLRKVTQDNYQLVVTDDIPRCPKPFNFIPDLRYLNKGKKIYSANNIIYKRRFGKGSVNALRSCIEIAEKQGAKYVFIHLDDHIYLPIFQSLIKNAISALDHEQDLNFVGFSGYPLINKNSSPDLGNKSFLTIKENKINFDNIQLQKKKIENFTLWYSELNNASYSENFWPITLWMNIYRIEFLKELLSRKDIKKIKYLGKAELWYQKNWEIIKEDIHGNFGFINMQFGGFEMHRNKNWKTLIQYPNNPVQ